MHKRVVSLWFPRLPSDRSLRSRALDAPLALTVREANTDRLYCLNGLAERQGLHRGMGLADARALCPDLRTRPADPQGDLRFLQALGRWAGRYSPWVGLEGRDGLVLNITGAAHLFGGEAGLLGDIRARMSRAGLQMRAGLGDTRGAAWGLARYAEGVAAPDAGLAALADLPLAALRLSDASCTALQRMGVYTLADLHALPRANLARRFGQDVLMRLDQALGTAPEEISSLGEAPHYGVRLTLPDPIGLTSDVMAGVARLLDALCQKLENHAAGARVLRLTLRRVDQKSQEVELRLARPLREPARILPLFERGVGEVDSGYGIDQIRLEAVEVETLQPQQIRNTGHSGDTAKVQNDRLHDLITRLGNRIGLESIIRYLPADSHIPERSFIISPAAWSEPAPGPWPQTHPRPLRIFAPEAVNAPAQMAAAIPPQPPKRFAWRRMPLITARSTGPERIAPEWWLDDDTWRSGLRDYWRVETQQGRRLWMFYTPQNPGWFVQGEFA